MAEPPLTEIRVLIEPEQMRPSFYNAISHVAEAANFSYDAEITEQLTSQILKLETERRAMLKTQIDSAWELVFKIGKAARLLAPPTKQRGFEPVRQDILLMHRDLVLTISHLRQAKQYTALTWWADRWGPDAQSKVFADETLRRFTDHLCKKRWECLFRQFDDCLGFLNEVALPQMEQFRMWTQLICDELSNFCSCCNYPAAFHLDGYFLLKWKKAAEALETFQKPICIKAKAINLISPVDVTPGKKEVLIEVVAEEEDGQKKYRSRAVPKATTVGPKTSTKVQTQARDEIRATALKIPRKKHDARASELPKQSPSLEHESWTRFWSQEHPEKPLCGHSIETVNAPHVKHKTRPISHQSKKQEKTHDVDKDPEVAAPERKKWIFTNAAHFETWRHIFPLPGPKGRETSVSWDAFRAALEDEPLCFKMVSCVDGVISTFERPAMDGLSKMSFVCHRPHALKPELERYYLQSMKTRLRRKFDWEAEDFELAQS